MCEFPLKDCFIADAGGQIVGVAGYRVLDAENAKTTLMVVDPTCRGLGIGLALQRARMDFLRGRGIRFLTTNCDDPSVIAWYTKHFGHASTGFRVPKSEDFGLATKAEWTTIRCQLTTE